MSQQLALDIDDETYALLQQKANAAGLSAAEWLIELALNQRSNTPKSEDKRSEAQKEEARQRFRRHAGAMSNVGSTDNESIDADLAKAYANEY